MLSVDLPPCGPDPGSSSPEGRVRAMAKHLSLHGRFYLDEKQAVCEGPPDHSSLCSTSTSSTSAPQGAPGQDEGDAGPAYPSLKSAGQPPGSASTLVLQMEHERERGNLSKCLKLAREREEMERELRKYTLERTAGAVGRRDEPGTEGGEGRRENAHRGGDESRDSEDTEPVWKPKHKASPQCPLQTDRGRCSTPGRPSSLSSIHWESGPLISPTRQVPALTICSPLKKPPDAASVKQTRLTSTATGRHPEGRSIHLHTKPPLQRKVLEKERLVGRNDNLTLDRELQREDSVFLSQRLNDKRRFHEVEPFELRPDEVPASPDRGRCVQLDLTACSEMSVDDPEEDKGLVCSPTKIGRASCRERV